MKAKTVTGYRFRPAHMNVAARIPGIGAFLRTRNGADFVEATIRSHVEFYDEIVAVYNQCTDDTPRILERLAAEFAPRIRLYHYTDRVQPLGSRAHAETPGDHPESMVNYSNFALAQTRHKIAVKLDDDHLAIPARVAEICENLRAGRMDRGVYHCFSGLNLALARDGRLGIPAYEPLSGNGDIGYFEVNEKSRFYHDRRFERVGRGGLRRRFSGYLYWHLKFLKSGDGFGNYELADNPDSRFGRKRVAFERTALLDLPAARRAITPSARALLARGIGGKAGMLINRDAAITESFPDDSLVAALDRTSPGWRDLLGIEAHA